MSVTVLENPRQKPNEDLILWLERILKLAKSGELRGFLGVLIYPDDETQNVWVTSEGHRPLVLLGALEQAKIDYGLRIREIRSGETDDVGPSA